MSSNTGNLIYLLQVATKKLAAPSGSQPITEEWEETHSSWQSLTPAQSPWSIQLCWDVDGERDNDP